MWKQGDWTLSDGKLLSPKQFGARIEIPCTVPDEYRLTAIIEPLDEPNGLLFGLQNQRQRFVTLFSFARGDMPSSAIENIDGQNVGNESTYRGTVFQKGQLSEVTVTVRRNRIVMAVDGQVISDWRGKPEQLSLSDDWTTPNPDALFLGAYDCRYRYHRVTLRPLNNHPPAGNRRE